MKMVAISDTHMKHGAITPPNGDVLIHAGDYSHYGNYDDFSKFIHWLAELPHTYKVFIAGNHDLWLDGVAAWAVQDIICKMVGENSGITYLFDSSVEIMGKKFYGAPWQPYFCDWAFQAPRGAPMANKWSLIPGDTDVLITHGPPYGHGDYVPRDKRMAGCLELLKKIVEVSPDYHICGHIHEGYGRTCSEEAKTTKFINASICDGSYKPTNKSVRIDYP